MAVPTGFNETNLTQTLGGCPLDYQLVGYLAKHTTASANQQTTLKAIATHKQGSVDVDEVIRVLAKTA